MNADQHTNIETMVNVISETLFSAWSYFHILEGFHVGSKSHPVVVQKFDRLFDQLWRAVFDGLFAGAGTLIDRTRNTYSLPNLVTIALRYGDAELKSVAKSVQVSLNAQDGPLAKLESWRHEAVAHRTPNGRADGFHTENKMCLGDVADGLRQMEQLLNVLSVEALRVHNDTETGNLDLVQQGIDLFACVANQQVKSSCNTQ
jgi:AbiU2